MSTPKSPSKDLSGALHDKTANFFQAIWSDYIAFNPQAKRVYDVILEREQSRVPTVKALVNDHVALRTYNHPKVSESVLAKPFLDLGYEPKGEYVFKQKKLFARHYEGPSPDMPKVFISELELEKCSELVQKVALEVIDSLDEKQIAQPAFIHSRRTWKASFATYEKLLAESEYAAWLYAFGYRANHFTVSFNDLNSFATLEELNTFIKSNGYALNTSGGEIKGTPAELLEQSSTLAEPTKVDFVEGTREIPACYYEFARRYADAKGVLYTGFIAASADKIFESTNVNR